MRGLVLVALLLGAATAALAAAPAYVWHLPAGIAPPLVPAGNPMSDAKVELGRRLFYDADLSLDGTTSCATCHEQHRAFTEGNANHPGVGGAKGRRNVMALGNVAYLNPLTWADPTQHTLEAQLLVPMLGTHPVEMGMAGKEADIATRLAADDCYKLMFAAAFPDQQGRINVGTVGKALASFERSLVSYGSPYDKFRGGVVTAISDSAKRGAKLFAAECSGCHSGINFTDMKFHNIGLYDVDGAGGYPASDHGLVEISGKPADEGAIRTPSLRNVALTGPWMHDGSVISLEDAIRRHFDGSSKLRDARLKQKRPDDKRLADLVSFLQSLSDAGFVTDPALALPKMACGKPL
jgi:cytochrome c peroxidase